jgi:hypothetical protein
MAAHSIPPPKTWVTDRELALMNTLDKLFPKSPHILYIWHVNMNVLANYRKHFPKDKQGDHRIIPNPGWELFLKDWNKVVDSVTEAEYVAQLTEFRKHWTHNEEAVDYVEDTWLTPWKEKLVQF